MAANRALALEARAVLLAALGTESPCPESMIGSIASIPLPRGAAGSLARRLDGKALYEWFRAQGVETWLHDDPIPVLRVSAQLYNTLDQFKALARLLEQALRAESGA
jgi:isopenicillin-N epimerase